jgi:hypothetical protein
MTYEERQREIFLGEHSKLQPPNSSFDPEIEMTVCDGCGREMEYHDHYINGGICYLCISRIGT